MPVRIPRAQLIQRLQIGLSGLAAMVLLVGLASVVRDRSDLTDKAIIADAGNAPPTAADPAPQSDPLADAGLVPDLPAETATAPAPAQPLPSAAPGPAATNAPPQ